MGPGQALLAWYDRHRRELPWRADRDPFRVWVSEVMLQQTRAETVIPYYRRFLHRFPTVEALAAADGDEVLAAWSGLGYYRRARQLHQAARQIVAAGAFPETAAELRRLPGIGDYTAAAVASIAFGAAVPVLDGNVARVVARLLALGDDPRSASGRRRLLAAAAGLLDPERPGDSNQALMELGATLCRPARARCAECPLGRWCRAARAGEPERYPPPRPRRRPVTVQRLVALVERDGRVLLFRRPEGSRVLAGTWELPWAERDGAAGSRSAGRGREERALRRRYGGRWRIGERLAAVRHGITHRRIELDVYRCRVDGEGQVGEGIEAGWFGADERRRLPLSSLVGKVLAAAASAAGPLASPEP